MIQWLANVDWPATEDWMRLGWMFALRSGGYHRSEYGWIMEYRCSCRPFDQPPTPERKSQCVTK